MEYFYHYQLSVNKVKELKEEIDHVVQSHSDKLDPSVFSISTQNGDQYHLNHNCRSKYPKSEQTLKDIIFECLEQTNLYIANAWAVYGKKGGYHTIHSHNPHVTQDICTVTYLEVGDEEKPGGDFYYIMNGEAKHFTPSTGDVLVFPTFLYHGTYPQTSDIRQTLNVDFTHVEKLTDNYWNLRN
jgi:hypothetical protein